MSFKGFLKGNTTVTLKLGPFLDSTDGTTAETALTVSQADVRLSKNGGDFAQKNDTNTATHDELGYYDCQINTTDTNTYGILRVVVAESGALVVDQSYAVLPEPLFASFFPSASGDPLPVFGILDWGTAQASASGTLVHRPGLNLANDIPNGAAEHIYSGTGAGQTRIVYDFVNATDTASISPDWTTTPSTDSLYVTFGAPPAPTNSAAIPAVNTTHAAGTAWGSGAITAASIASDAITAAKIAADAITAAKIATGAIDADAIAADAVTEIQSGLATAAALATVDAIADTLALGIIIGSAVTGTLSTTQATSDLTGYADNQLIGRVIIWTSGACDGEATDITGYASTGGLLTFTALTTAPANGDTFKIV